jgi:hypothetical protein
LLLLRGFEQTRFGRGGCGATEELFIVPISGVSVMVIEVKPSGGVACFLCIFQLSCPLHDFNVFLDSCSFAKLDPGHNSIYILSEGLLSMLVSLQVFKLIIVIY